jgi:hypothetical protein
MNNIAWLLATSPEAKLRDGKEAVAVATKAMQIAGGNDPALLDTVAAAYAEAGGSPKRSRRRRKRSLWHPPAGKPLSSMDCVNGSSSTSQVLRSMRSRKSLRI